MDLKNMTRILERYIGDCLLLPDVQLQHLSGAGATFMLEEKLCRYFGKKYALSFCNATTALLTLSLALGVKNKEIVTTPFNWEGSIGSFLMTGSRLVFGGVEENTLNIDANRIESSVTAKTKVVLSVDFCGTPADSFQIKKFCSQNGLFYISDSAQSMGANRDDKPAGYFADAIVLSFGPGKSFYGAEGGAILTDDSGLYEKMIWLSRHPNRQKRNFGLTDCNLYSPINGRMNPLSSIILNELFMYYFEKLKVYQDEFFSIFNHLNETGFVWLPDQFTDSTCSTYHNPILRLQGKKLQDEFETSKFNLRLFRPNCIPWDRSFVKQFRGRFNISYALKEQMDFFKKEMWIKITKG
jgi:perosamine synthetase